MSPALLDLRSRRGALLLMGASLGLGGCELVFGLDDYAQATSESTTAGSTSTESGTGGSASGQPSAAGGGSASSADGGASASTSTSTSSSEGGGCPCVPDGWTLVESFPVAADAAPTTCASSVSATRALEDPAVGCECSCGVTEGVGCQLTCWEQPGCDPASPVSVLDDAVCNQIPVRRSCAVATVRNGAPTTDVCAASGVVTVSASNGFDLCVAPPDGACPGAGVCGLPSTGALWCIRGPADEACPADWPDAHDLSVGGTPSCACGCVDSITCSDGYRTSTGSNCIGNGTTVNSRACIDVGDAESYGGPIGGGMDGECGIVAVAPPGTLEGAEDDRLCCRPL